MKKLLFILPVAVALLSSCLKDKANTDFSSIDTRVELPYSGLQYFTKDAVTDAGPAITKVFQINIASAYPLSTDTKVTIGVDYSLLTAYNAANKSIVYEQMPAGSFTINKTEVTIEKGTRLDSIVVTFDKSKLDPSKSYMLPISILSSDAKLTGNFNTHYYHFIGNDFAGTYTSYYDRWPVPDTTGTKDNNHLNKGTVTFSPVNPTEFTVRSFYYTQPPYHVTFTKTGTGSTATYSNFKVDFTADDLTSFFGTAVTLAKHPEIRPRNNVNYDPTKQYTFAESLLLFRFFYTTATRAVIDTYVK